MSVGSHFGQRFRITTCGESHGPVMAVIVEGCPANLSLSVDDIQPDLDRRKPGTSQFVSQRKEPDLVEIKSGVFEGKTTGAPILLEIPNINAKPKDYDEIKQLFRPGHADYTVFQKYGHRDWRGGGRLSARETVARVAAGAIARKLLHQLAGISVQGYVSQIGEIKYTSDFNCRDNHIDFNVVNANPFYFPDKNKLADLELYLQALRKSGDSIGAKIHLVAKNVPVGLGEPVFDKLDADFAKALMSIPAVKAVEIGDGVEVITQRGSEHRDEMTPTGFLSNHSGGTLGGISTGQDIRLAMSLKPTSSIRLPALTVDEQNLPANISTTGRHDPCVGLRAVPIAEAMVLLVLADHYLRAYVPKL
jgi:chorismate synthase